MFSLDGRAFPLLGSVGAAFGFVYLAEQIDEPFGQRLASDPFEAQAPA